MKQPFEDTTSEERMLREYKVTASACRQLASWALAHFGDRTDPEAYQRIVISMASTGPDYAAEKVFNDLCSQGFTYRYEAVWRMYERFRRDEERKTISSGSIAA